MYVYVCLCACACACARAVCVSFMTFFCLFFFLPFCLSFLFNFIFKVLSIALNTQYWSSKVSFLLDPDDDGLTMEEFKNLTRKYVETVVTKQYDLDSDRILDLVVDTYVTRPNIVDPKQLRAVYIQVGGIDLSSSDSLHDTGYFVFWVLNVIGYNAVKSKVPVALSLSFDFWVCNPSLCARARLICLPVGLFPLSLSVCLSASRSILSVFVCLSVCLSVCLPVGLFFLSLSVCLSVCLSVSLSLSLSVSLSLSQRHTHTHTHANVHKDTNSHTHTHTHTHTPLTQRSRGGLTMPLSRRSKGTYQETSSYATRQGNTRPQSLSSLSHCGLILA